MSGPPNGPRRVAPIPPGNRTRTWLWVVVSGTAGALALVATFLLVQSRLPAEVPSHYGFNGQVNATMTPVEYLLTALFLQALVTALFAVVLFAGLRSGVVEQQQGPRFSRRLGILLSALAALMLPAQYVFRLLADAGYFPATTGTGPIVSLGLLLVPLVVFLAVILVLVRRSGTSAAVQFECSACGEPFTVPTWRWIVGPHIGSSVYLTCPRCGERGWDLRLRSTGWESRSEAADSQRLP